MKWITRERPRIDRGACPWLIARFIDPAAEFIFVPQSDVEPRAAGSAARVVTEMTGSELESAGTEGYAADRPTWVRRRQI